MGWLIVKHLPRNPNILNLIVSGARKTVERKESWSLSEGNIIRRI